MSKIIIALGAVIVFGGGVSLAASQAVPGDMLYGYKLSVNEKVGDMLAMSDSARTDRDITLAERRLTEASVAAGKGTIEADVYSSLVADFNDRMKNISDTITKLEAEDRDDEAKTLAADVARVLSRQSQTLLAAQAAATTRGDVGTGQSLDFIILNVTRSLTAAAVIATGQTTIEGSAAGGTQLEGTPEVPDAELNP
ncbi:MAG: hypothetical protein KBD50_02835 [Candidatus Pacebacteria bacterium]|nr:hypothetical protein [Candidatus Paceibacterota bacterium]